MSHFLMIRRLLIAGALPLSATLFAGCGRTNFSETPPAIAATLPTPKPKPTRKPAPTPAPKSPPAAKGVAFFGIKTKAKVFALTFDDGPDPTYTPQVLKILRAKNAPATFFMVGKMVRAHPSTAKKVQAAGFPIGAHSWSHPMKTKNPVAEIDLTDKILKSTLNLTPTLFRPPYGITNNGLASQANARGQNVILWNSTANDWNKKNSSQQLEANVLTHLAPGGIALMHDGGGDRSKTVAMLPGLIDTIRERGYQLVTVPQLLNMGDGQTKIIGARTSKRLHNRARIQQAAKKHGLTAAQTAAALPAKSAAPAKIP